MRLLHVVPTYLPAWRYGGLIHSVHGLCKGLVDRGHDVEVFTTNVDGPGEADVPVDRSVDVDGVKVTYFRSRFRRLYWSPQMSKALQNRVSSFDLLHLHSIFLWPTLAAGRAARHAGVPYVVAPRGMLVKELVARRSRFVKTMWLSILERGTIEAADALHFTSALEKAEAERFGWSFRRSIVVPNGVDLPSQRAASNGEFVLFVGRINWKKGLEKILEALAIAPAVRVVIAGNDEGRYKQKLESMAKALGVADRVEFRGFVAGEEKQDLYRRAAALVLPSLSENFGNVVLEAMAAGCPVIVTPSVGLAEVVRRERAGIVTEAEPRSLAAAMETLWSDAAGRREMGARGRRAVADQFTWDRVAEQMETSYRKLLH